MFLTILSQYIFDYKLICISEENIQDVYRLLKDNKDFFSSIQKHEVTLAECVNDISSIPPNKSLNDKYYIAVYDKENCVAVIDFINSYPTEKIGYLGFFVVAYNLQGKGVGKKLITSVFKAAKELGLEKIELGCYESNVQGIKFWKKIGFVEIGRSETITDGEKYFIISMQCRL